MESGTPHAPRYVTRALAAALLSFAVLLSAAVPGASATSGCDRVASPSGSDSAPGSETAPWRSAQKLVDSLQPGETGCLRAGTYGGSGLRMKAAGSTLRSYPGEKATVTAFLEVYPEAARATVTGLRLDETHNGNGTGVKLQADGTRFVGNELTKGGNGICLIAASWNDARDIVIERNHIYDCGPGDSKYDHQLYIQHARGAVIRWNILNGNHGGWGVHLYTDADGTVVEHNVIDGNRGGVVFAGADGETSDNNVVRNNAITYNGPRWNVEASWSDGPMGSGNRAYDNCLHSTSVDAPAGIGDERGFLASRNSVLADSPYADRAAGDFRFRSSSPCARLVGDVAGAAVMEPFVTAAERATLTLRSSRRRVRPGRKLLLRGRIRGRRPAAGARVALQIRSRGRWRTFARRTLTRGGRFHARHRVGRARRSRTTRMRAVVRGVARSRVIRLRIRP